MVASGGEVAADEEGDHARVVAQPGGLGGHRRLGDRIVGGGPRVAPLVAVDLALPLVAAFPAGERQDAVAVGQVEEFVRLDVPFQPDGVQAQVEGVPQPVLDVGPVPAQELVGRPTAALDQQLAAVDAVLAVAGGVQRGPDITDAEGLVRGVGGGAVHGGDEVEGVERLAAHARGPPDLRRVQVEAEGDGPRLVCGEGDGRGEGLPADAAPDLRRDGRVRVVAHPRLHRQVGGGERRHGQLGHHMGVAQRDRAAAADEDVTDDAHVLVGRWLEPVDPAHGEVLVRVVRPDAEGDRVGAGTDQRGDVRLVLCVGAVDVGGLGDLLAVDVDVGRRDHPAEVEVGALGGVGDREVAAVPPRHLEVGLRDLLLVGRVEGVGVHAVGDQGREDCRARAGRVPAGRPIAGGGDGRGGVADLGGRLDRIAGQRSGGPGRRAHGGHRGRCAPLQGRLPGSRPGAGGESAQQAEGDRGRGETASEEGVDGGAVEHGGLQPRQVRKLY
jgi:hypothetical protein